MRPSLRARVNDKIDVLIRRFPKLRSAARQILPRAARDMILRVLRQAGTRTQDMRAKQVPLSSGHASTGCFDVICFANIGWSARYQRPQQLMQQFANHGHRVFYIDPAIYPRGGEPYVISLFSERLLEVGLRTSVRQDCYADRMTTQTLSDHEGAVRALVRDFRIRSAVLIVQLPYWASLARRLRQAQGWRVAYDCMDEWDSFPKIGKALIEEERALVAECDLVTVTGSVLLAKWEPANPNCVLVRNGVDNRFFSSKCAPNELLSEIAHPIIGYYGALAEWVDFDLIARIADARRDWSFVLIGDVFTDEADVLQDRPNVHLLGLKPYADMPRYLYHFDVCIIPFKLNKVTHAVDPVKFYEYMSAGKPTVAVPLLELKPYERYLEFAEGPAEFIASIKTALKETDTAAERSRVAFAQQNDWTSRFEVYKRAVTNCHPLVSIIIVTHENVDLSRLCVESVLSSTSYPRYEVIIVDNSSSDGTRNYLRYLARRHVHVRIILNDHNRGFAAANNQALAKALGDYLVLLNNDTVVPHGWLEGLLRHLTDESIGLVGPVTNFAGNEARIAVDYDDLSEMQSFADRQADIRKGRSFDISMLAMFCVAFRRDVLDRVGFLDEGYQVGLFEDDDYSMRVREAGFRVVCSEDVYVHHFGQAAFKKLIPSGEYQRIWNANQAYYERKWGIWKPHSRMGGRPGETVE